MQISPWFWHTIAFLSYLLCRIRLSIKVRQHAESPEGPVLLCAKHGSGFDIPLLANWSYRLRKKRPYFQMGSFIGYPVFGPLVPAMRRLGGFNVMRPKEVLRLRRKEGWSRERVRETMSGVNEAAEQIRRDVLRSRGVLVVFPEGTRNDAAVLPLVSELEVHTAVSLVPEGLEPMIWPTVLSYGTRRFFRRPLIVDFLPPFPVGDNEPGTVLRMVSQHFEKHWIPPVEVDALVPQIKR